MNKEGTGFCPECGKEVLATAKRCNHCAAILLAGWGANSNPGSQTVWGLGITVLAVSALLFGLVIWNPQNHSSQPPKKPIDKHGSAEVDEQIEQDKAFSAIRKDALKGVAASQFTLAEMYQEGRGVEQDIDQATFWYRMAAQNTARDREESSRILTITEDRERVEAIADHPPSVSGDRSDHYQTRRNSIREAEGQAARRRCVRFSILHSDVGSADSSCRDP